MLLSSVLFLWHTFVYLGTSSPRCFTYIFTACFRSKSFFPGFLLEYSRFWPLFNTYISEYTLCLDDNRALRRTEFLSYFSISVSIFRRKCLHRKVHFGLFLLWPSLTACCCHFICIIGNMFWENSWWTLCVLWCFPSPHWSYPNEQGAAMCLGRSQTATLGCVGPHWFNGVRVSDSSVLKFLLSGVTGSIRHLLVIQKILCL